MKILYLLTQDLESPSGLGRYWPLAREMAHLGNDVTVAALHSNYGELTYKRFKRDGVNIWYVAPMHVRKQGSIKKYYSTPRLLWIAARATWGLSRAALSLSADIIHICKPHPMNGVAGIIGRYFRGRQIYLDCDDYETQSNRFGAGWQKIGVSIFERWLPHHVHIITTHSEFLLSRLRADGIPPERIFYVPNGVDRQRFVPPDPQDVVVLRKKLGLEGKEVIAFIGSLSLAGHPVNLLLKAFVNIHKMRPESILMLVGGGEDFDELQSQAKSLGIGDATIFCGRVLPEDVRMYYFLSNVSVDPVYDDGAARGRSPLKLFESWACGVPFVSADVGDRRNLLGDPPAGLLAQPGDPISLAEMVLRVLNNQALAQSLKQRGLERVKFYFWDELAVKMNSIYQRKYYPMSKGA
jgi:glycosyltransferase involved in cell wall biosynthesis